MAVVLENSVSLPTWAIIPKPCRLAVLRSCRAEAGEQAQLEGWPRPARGSRRAPAVPQLRQDLSLCTAGLPCGHQKRREMTDISHFDLKTCSELQPPFLSLWGLSSG